MRRLAAALLMALLVALAGSACVQLPDDGPIVVGTETGRSDLESGIPYAPRGPQRGESSTEIVRHFLDAMTANPVRTSVARQFLSSSAGESWNPEQRTIIYDSLSRPDGIGVVELSLNGASWLDARGTWRGALPREASELSFPMEIEDGEWRISEVPDAMIVSEDWFDDRFRQVSLYFYDPGAQILVPELVFLPRGDQLATSLIRGLLQGPPNERPGTTPSFFPRGASLDDLSVPVAADGLADVSLSGDIASMSPESLDLMTAQIAWTLRQDPRVKRVRVSIGDAPVTLAGGGTEFSVEVGAPYDPAGAFAVRDPFGLRDGRLASFVDAEAQPVSGPFGARAHGLRDFSVDLPGERVAGVTDGGRTLLLAPVEADPERPVQRVASGTDLLHPAWDAGGRLWVLDRAGGRAQVSMVVGGREVPVVVPGVTGRDVVDFLVSRDGSRFVAAVADRGTHQVVVSRIGWNRDRAVLSPAQVIERGDGRQLTVRDLSWASPTQVLLVLPLERQLSEVRTVSVDGSPVIRTEGALVETLRADVQRLVGSPVPGRPIWAVTPRGALLQLAPDQSAAAPADLAVLRYVG